MADLIERGTRHLNGKLRSHASRQVVYSRPGTALTATVPATVGSTVLSLSDGMGGTRIVRTDRTYGIDAADLAAFGEPLPGDKVAETAGGVTYTHDVLPYGGTEPCWRWADGCHLRYLIHAKQTGVA